MSHLSLTCLILAGVLSLAISMPSTSCTDFAQSPEYDAVLWHGESCSQVTSEITISAMVYVSVSNLSFTSGSLVIYGDSEVSATNAILKYINITNSIFNDSTVFVQDYMPLGTLIQFANNTFRNYNAFDEVVTFDRLVLLGGVQIKIHNNSFLLEPDSNVNFYSVNFLVFRLTMLPNAIVEVKGNVVKYIAATQLWNCFDPIFADNKNVFIQMVWVRSLSMRVGSSMIIDSNNFDLAASGSPLMINGYMVSLKLDNLGDDVFLLEHNSELIIKENTVTASLVTNHSSGMVLLNIYFDMNISGALVLVSNNNLSLAAPTPNTAIVVGISTLPMALRSSASFMVEGNRLTVVNKLPLCYTSPPTHKSNLYLFRIVNSPYVALGPNATIGIKNNTLLQPQAPRMDLTTLSDVMLFQLVTSNISMVDSTVAITDNSVVVWAVPSCIYIVSEGFTPIHTVLHLSKMTCLGNHLQQNVSEHTSSAPSIFNTPSSSIRVILSQSIISLSHNTLRIESRKTSISLIFVRVNIGHLMLTDGSHLVADNNEGIVWAGNTSQTLVGVMTATNIAQLLVSRLFFNRSKFQLFPRSSDEKYSNTPLLSPIQSNWRSSTLQIRNNLLTSHSERTIANNSYRTSGTDTHYMLRVVGIQLFRIDSGSLAIVNNTFQLSGVATPFANFVPSILTTSLTVLEIDGNATLWLHKNTFDASRLITSMTLKLIVLLNSNISIANSTMIVTNNLVSGQIVRLLPAAALSVDLAILSASGVIYLEGTAQFLENRVEYRAMIRRYEDKDFDPGNTFAYYPDTSDGLLLTFTILNISGTLQTTELLLIMINNSIVLQSGTLAAIALIRTNVTRYTMRQPLRLEVCGNSANNNLRKFDDAELTLGDFRASLRQVGMPDVNYTACKLITTPSQSLTISSTVSHSTPMQETQPPAASVINQVTSNTATATGILSTIGGGIVTPSAAMQQGVALALLRMAECEEDPLNGKALDVLVHPLQFGVGEGVASYARGAIIGNLLLLPILWAGLSYWCIPHLIALVTKQSIETARTIVGWPSCLLVPFSILAEGSAMATIALLTLGGEAIDVVLGVIGALALVSSLSAWLYMMVFCLNGSQMKIVFVRRGDIASRLIDTRWEWTGTGTHLHESKLHLHKYNHCYGEFWWVWSCFSGYAFSLLVGLAEGMPNNTDTLCRARWVVACVGAVFQSLAVLTCSIPIQLCLLGLTGILICVLVGMVAFTTFGGNKTAANGDALNVIGTLNAFIGMALMGFGVARLIFEFFEARGRRQSIILSLKASTDDLELLETFHPSDTHSASESTEEPAGKSSNPISLPEREHEDDDEVLPERRSLPEKWRHILEEADALAHQASLANKEQSMSSFL